MHSGSIGNDFGNCIACPFTIVMRTILVVVCIKDVDVTPMLSNPRERGL